MEQIVKAILALPTSSMRAYTKSHIHPFIHFTLLTLSTSSSSNTDGCIKLGMGIFPKKRFFPFLLGRPALPPEPQPPPAFPVHPSLPTLYECRTNSSSSSVLQPSSDTVSVGVTANINKFTNYRYVLTEIHILEPLNEKRILCLVLYACCLPANVAEAELEPQCGSDDRKEASEPKIRELFAFSIVLNYSAALYLVAILSSATTYTKKHKHTSGCQGESHASPYWYIGWGDTGQMDRRLTFWGSGSVLSICVQLKARFMCSLYSIKCAFLH